MTVEMIVVLSVIGVALVLFVWEPIPIDQTAIGIMVALLVLHPWTGITIGGGLAGFSSSATITVLAMFVLSEGVRRTGLITLIGRKIAEQWGDSPFKQLAAVLGLSGGTAGVINNTPVVAILIPMVDELSDRTGISPSKLLMPISFAAMMGGMLTLIGTSTNLLASDVYASMGDQFQAFSIFEFTLLGAIVTVVGCVFLLLFSRFLLPERIKGREELTDEYEMGKYLTEVRVKPKSSFVGRTVDNSLAELDVDVDIVQLIRENKAYTEPLSHKEIHDNDVLVLRTDRSDLATLIEAEGLGLAPVADKPISDDALRVEEENPEEPVPQELLEVVVTPDSTLIGNTLEELNFRNRYDASVLAIRRGEEVIHVRMNERPLRGGDTLLIQTGADTIRRLTVDRNFIVASHFDHPVYREEKLPLALGIVFAVVALAGLGWTPIVLSALGGMFAMVATGCLRPNEVYDAVDWNVIFLLAGLIPLGTAMTRTNTAHYLAEGVLGLVHGTPALVLLGVFYVLTAVLTNLISNNASVILMIPVAVDVAQASGLNPFAFAMAVTFAASTAFMTPVGYQTNLMVYGPGGYRFTDFIRLGAPLQLLIMIVTILGIAMIWGVA